MKGLGEKRLGLRIFLVSEKGIDGAGIKQLVRLGTIVENQRVLLRRGEGGLKGLDVNINNTPFISL